VFFSHGLQQDWSLPTGLAVTYLGSSSGAPTRDRNVSCTVLRLPESLYLVDCGEGSSRQMKLTGMQLEQVRGWEVWGRGAGSGRSWWWWCSRRWRRRMHGRRGCSAVCGRWVLVVWGTSKGWEHASLSWPYLLAVASMLAAQLYVCGNMCDVGHQGPEA
jgi:hypothetical protein